MDDHTALQTALPRIDSHAHVWDRTCRFVPGARYHPDYEATIDTYLRVLDAHGVERAVLVQPSFLGTDNSYLVGCLRAHPDRLRGIVVLDPRIGDAELNDLAGTGVIGHRYDMVSRDASVLSTPAFRALTDRATQRGWWTEVQAHGSDWPGIARLMGAANARLMVDHFGLPSGLDCPGIAALAKLDRGRLSLKLSAPYRQTIPDFARAVARLIDDDVPGSPLGLGLAMDPARRGAQLR